LPHPLYKFVKLLYLFVNLTVSALLLKKPTVVAEMSSQRIKVVIWRFCTIELVDTLDVLICAAAYRSERACLSSAAVASDSNKCYAEFERGLMTINAAQQQRQRSSIYYQHSACLLMYAV